MNIIEGNKDCLYSIDKFKQKNMKCQIDFTQFHHLFLVKRCLWNYRTFTKCALIVQTNISSFTIFEANLFFQGKNGIRDVSLYIIFNMYVSVLRISFALNRTSECTCAHIQYDGKMKFQLYENCISVRLGEYLHFPLSNLPSVAFQRQHCLQSNFFSIFFLIIFFPAFAFQ